MKKILPIAAAALLAVSLTACSSDAGTVDQGGAEAAAESQASKSQEQKTAETSAPAESGDPKFGDAYTWENGLKVAISAPKSFKPSDTSFAEIKGKPQVFTITVTNGTGEDFDPVTISTTASSGGAEAEPIFDSASGISLPSTTVKPGKTLTFKVAFDVSDPKDITMDVAPGFEYDTKTFVS